MILAELFWGFIKVGCFSFGGAYAAIPLIREVVLAYGWLDEDMLTYMIAVSESTPGPIMVNVATYVGASQAGIPGAAIATFAVVLPAFLLVLMITAVLSKVIGNKYVQSMLRGIKPSIIGIILTTGIWMIFQNLLSNEKKVEPRAALVTVILGGIYFGCKYLIRKKISPIVLICISAVIGCVVYSL